MSWRDQRPPATTTPNGYPYNYPYYPYYPYYYPYVPPTQWGATDKCNGKFARAQKVELLQNPPAVAHHGPVHVYR